MQTPLIENYRRLLASIAELAARYERRAEDIQLIAVSKTQSWNEIAPLYDGGQLLFGESRLQEALEKISLAPKDIEWHLIGPLQKNKVRKAVSAFSLIHSVNSLELAQKISSCSLETGLTTRILLQVNTSGESSKQGMTAKQALSVVEAILALPALKVEGLMTMAPLTKDHSLIRQCFAGLRLLKEELQSVYGNQMFTQLSMGMSNDYPLAIAEGATLLRIGSLLFSPQTREGL